ncbi:acyl-CoA thioesterase [Mesobacterium pallidum]|uniref:acyl-CoA thioesterase n=1 Tax=Mesobacterium pallidum TaxID=2872037 RepID=UPI001EE1F7D3|nr:acyl-CoA thioesterase [Mesobacterium pallidum]
MYPVLRMTKEMARARRMGPLDPEGTHVSYHRCWPWDIDMFLELNNGRTLTLYDLGRVPLAQRTGFLAALRTGGWSMTMAGAMVRYRRRVRPFASLRMTSRLACWDHRFFYLEQTMWLASGEAANNCVYRAAVVGKDGIVPPQTVAEVMGHAAPSPEVPAWIAAWVAAEDLRPWPPVET